MRPTYFNLYERLQTLANDLRAYPPSREHSMAITKLDEARLWIREAASITGWDITRPAITMTDNRSSVGSTYPKEAPDASLNDPGADHNSSAGSSAP